MTYTFPPALRFIGRPAMCYVAKLREEVNEVATANHHCDVIIELWDVVHAAETAIRSLSEEWDVDAEDMRDHVIAKNRARGYYER